MVDESGNLFPVCQKALLSNIEPFARVKWAKVFTIGPAGPIRAIGNVATFPVRRDALIPAVNKTLGGRFELPDACAQQVFTGIPRICGKP